MCPDHSVHVMENKQGCSPGLFHEVLKLPFLESSVNSIRPMGHSDFFCNLFFFFYIRGGGDWDLNSRLQDTKAGTLLLELHLQHILVWLF